MSVVAADGGFGEVASERLVDMLGLARELHVISR